MNKINSNFEGPAIFVGMDVHKFSWNLGIHLDEMFMKNVHQKLIPPLWPIIVLQKWLVPIAEVKNTKRKPEMYNPLQYPCCKKETMLTLLRCNRLRCNRRGPPVDWEDITVSQLSIIFGDRLKLNL